MDQFERKSLNFLVELARIIRNMQMYNSNHPVVKAGVRKAHTMLCEVLRMQPNLSFGKGEDVLLIQNKQITEKNPAASRFVTMLGERNISGIIMRQGAPLGELESLIKLLATKADAVVVDGQIKQELLRPFKKISVNEIKYLMVGDDEDLESLTEARKFFNNIFSEEFKDLKGPDALRKIGAVIQKILPKLAEEGFDNSEGELWEFFEKSVTSFGGTGGVRGTQQSLLTTVRGMSPDIQKKLFGQIIRSPQQLEAVLKKFSDDRKASILVEDVNNNADIGKTMDTLLKTKGEIVKLTESLMKKFGDDEDKLDEFDKIFNMIQKIEIGDKINIAKRGKVIIADSNEEYTAQYQDILKKLNFDVEIENNGRKVLEKARKNETRPNLLIMDVKLTEMSGMEILAALDMERIKLPVILCTEMESLRYSFEVEMYYKLKFLKKPCNVKDLLEGIDELCPKPKEEEAVGSIDAEKAGELPEELKAELNKAREIQRNLMPKEFPETPGYDINAFYKPFDQVGGDYYDVIPIDDENIGLLVADVAGHGITGAMVMVMARSAIKTWAHTTTSPKELLTKANPIISRDILPGFFITVFYAVLNMPSRKITYTCAGHNPAVIWKYKPQGGEELKHNCLETKKGGMPLGIVAGPAFGATLREEEMQLERGDRLVLFTDGMVETMSPEQEEFSEERLYQAINQSAMKRSDVCIKHMVQSVITFQSTAPQHDDLTVMTLRCLK